MKKWIAMLLTLTLALSLSVTAFAAEINQDSDPKKADVKVTTSIEPTYTVTIPEDVQVTFNETSTQFGAIELTAAKLDPEYAVTVTLTASGTLKNEADKTKTIAYAVNSKDGAFSSAEYQNKGDRTVLTIDITQAAWDAAYAGEYSDTVTFTISYGKVTP